MSYLCIFGLVVSLCIMVSIFFQLRKRTEDRLNVWPLLIFSIAILIISLFPGVATLPSLIFHLNELAGGRLLALLLISNLVLWPLLLWERAKNIRFLIKFNTLIASHTSKKLDIADIENNMIWVIIPVFNESENLKALLPRIPKKINEIQVYALVIDDGSTDDSVEVAKANGCYVISLPVNCGGGIALRTGFLTALRYNAKIIVTIDGDGQHEPEEIEKVLTPVLENKADLVLGSRFLGGYQRVSWNRTIGLWIFNKVINLLQGVKITDCASGFRAIRGEILSRMRLHQEQYHTAELIIEAKKQNAIIKEIPIHAKLRMHGSSKKGRDLFYGFFFLRTVLKSWVR